MPSCLALRRAGFSVALAVAVGACAARVSISAQAPAVIQRVEALGTFTTNAAAYGRDAGNSVRLGTQILWIFGDTFTPDGFRSATAGWSTRATPRRLREAVDENNAPFQFYPFTADEVAFNSAHADPPACCSDQRGCPQLDPYCHCATDTDCARRVALWPGDTIDVGNQSAIAYYEKLIIGVAPFDFRHLGTGLARVDKGRTISARDSDARGQPITLFSEHEPNFIRAVAVQEASGPLVYVYGAVDFADCAGDILVGRVPRDQVGDRRAYAFWNGSAWVSDLDGAQPILHGIRGRLGSVVWNDYLGQYISGYSDVCTGGTGFHIRSAPRPEGPWSDPVVVDLAPLGATSDAYAGLLHGGLGTGREIVISYFQPDSPLEGRVHLVLVRFQ